MTQSYLHHQTPLFENVEINARLQKRVYLKMDCFQPIGSFKIRGIGSMCQEAIQSGVRHLVSSSGGNAGLAAAYAGRCLGVDVTVVVPETTSPTARRRIAAEGAEVIIHGAVWDEANQLALQLVDEVNGAYIHPFDHPTIWRGHATMIDELAGQGPKPDVLVVSVGGGGLLCGLLEGLHRNGWPDVPVLAVETAGADSLATSMKSGRLEMLPAITSIATTLGARQVTPQALTWSKRHPLKSVVVSDQDAVKACLQFADDLRVVVEPACGAALSLMYDNHRYLAAYQSVLMIVCGGAGVTIQQLLTWHQQFQE
jgi:L-serine/L-threonine ammonia-lyase